MNELAATTTLELEIGLIGTFSPGHPATPPSYASGGDPPEPDGIEDPDITSIVALRFGGADFDIMKGVDRSSAAWKTIVGNVLEFLGEDAVSALLAEAAP